MKLSTRDLLILATIGLVIGWGLDHWWQVARYQKYRDFHDKQMRSRHVTIDALMEELRARGVTGPLPAPNPPKD